MPTEGTPDEYDRLFKRAAVLLARIERLRIDRAGGKYRASSCPSLAWHGPREPLVVYAEGEKADRLHEWIASWPEGRTVDV